LGHQQSNDESKETKNGTENLNNENLDEPGTFVSELPFIQQLPDLQSWICSISQSSSTSIDTDRYTTHQVAHSNGQPSPEYSITSIVITTRVDGIALDGSEFRREYNCHDDTVNSNHFTENDGEEVLGADTGGADTTTED